MRDAFVKLPLVEYATAGSQQVPAIHLGYLSTSYLWVLMLPAFSYSNKSCTTVVVFGDQTKFNKSNAEFLVSFRLLKKFKCKLSDELPSRNET